MGYLVNPTAMRIGWFSNWATNYYTDHRYYGEQLYLVLRLRLYIMSIVEEPQWIIHKWIYSHIRISGGYWGYHAQIFYYDGILYDSWYECIEYIDTFTKRIAGYKQYNYTGRWAHPPRMQNSVMMDMLLIIILQRIFTTTPNPLQYTNQRRGQPLLGVALFNQLDNNAITHKGGNRQRWVLFYSLIKNIITRKASVASYITRNRGTSIRAIFGGYYKFYSIYYHARPWLTVHSKLLATVFTSMHNSDVQVRINYYLIDNRQVTAGFLATYIGWRLRQNYTLGMLLNPLQRELHRVMRGWRRAHRGGRKLRNKRVNHLLGKRHHNYLYELFKGYHREYTNLYAQVGTWINPESLTTQYQVASHLCDFSLQKYLTNLTVRITYYGVCRMVIGKRPHMLFFLKAIQSRMYAYHLFTPWYKGEIGESYIWARALIGDIRGNYNDITGQEQAIVATKKVYILPIWPAIRVGAWGLARYHDYIQYVTRKSHYYTNFQVSKGSIIRNRINRQSHKWGLLGFKIQLKGRFSRKQIAAKSIKNYGKMPLNTLNAHIDYAFRTVAIKNSAIGIKVWLYKGNYSLVDLYTVRTA